MDPKQEQLERQFAELEKALDEHLEEIFASTLSLHPCRMAKGKGANPIHDGLFSATILFSMGYGTRSGRGYILNIGISTLDHVSKELKAQIDAEAFHFVAEALPTYFPERELAMVQDGPLMKIVGDFSLR